MKVKKNILTILLCFLMCLSSTFTIVADDVENNNNEGLETTADNVESSTISENDDSGVAPINNNQLTLGSNQTYTDENGVTYNGGTNGGTFIFEDDNTVTVPVDASITGKDNGPTIVGTDGSTKVLIDDDGKVTLTSDTDKTTLTVTVSNQDSGSSMSAISVKLLDENNNEVASKGVDENGKVEFSELNLHTKYKLSINNFDYLFFLCNQSDACDEQIDGYSLIKVTNNKASYSYTMPTTSASFGIYARNYNYIEGRTAISGVKYKLYEGENELGELTTDADGTLTVSSANITNIAKDKGYTLKLSGGDSSKYVTDCNKLADQKTCEFKFYISDTNNSELDGQYTRVNNGGKLEGNAGEQDNLTYVGLTVPIIGDLQEYLKKYNGKLTIMLMDGDNVIYSSNDAKDITITANKEYTLRYYIHIDSGIEIGPYYESTMPSGIKTFVNPSVDSWQNIHMNQNGSSSEVWSMWKIYNKGTTDSPQYVFEFTGNGKSVQNSYATCDIKLTFNETTTPIEWNGHKITVKTDEEIVVKKTASLDPNNSNKTINWYFTYNHSSSDENATVEGTTLKDRVVDGLSGTHKYESTDKTITITAVDTNDNNAEKFKWTITNGSTGLTFDSDDKGWTYQMPKSITDSSGTSQTLYSKYQYNFSYHTTREQTEYVGDDDYYWYENTIDATKKTAAGNELKSHDWSWVRVKNGSSCTNTTGCTFSDLQKSFTRGNDGISINWQVDIALPATTLTNSKYYGYTFEDNMSIDYQMKEEQLFKDDLKMELSIGNKDYYSEVKQAVKNANSSDYTTGANTTDYVYVVETNNNKNYRTFTLYKKCSDETHSGTTITVNNQTYCNDLKLDSTGYLKITYSTTKETVIDVTKKYGTKSGSYLINYLTYYGYKKSDNTKAKIDEYGKQVPLTMLRKNTLQEPNQSNNYTAEYSITANEENLDININNDKSVIELTDTMSSTLDLVENAGTNYDLKVTAYEPSSTEGTVLTGGYSYTYEYLSNGKRELKITINKPENKTVWRTKYVVTYYAVLNTDAVGTKYSNSVTTDYYGTTFGDGGDVKQIGGNSGGAKRFSRTVKKVDSVTKKTLSGVKFTLSKLDNGTFKEITTKTTDSRGLAVFVTSVGELEYKTNTLYKIEETDASSGYNKSNTVYYFCLKDESADSCKFDGYSNIDTDNQKTYTVENQAKVKLTITKKDKDDEDTLLSDVTYGIYTDEKCTKLLVSKTTDSEGKIIIANYGTDSVNINADTQYYLKEISNSNNNYDLDDTVYPFYIHKNGSELVGEKVTINDSDGNCSIEKTNKYHYEVKLKKVDVDGNAALDGSVYLLNGRDFTNKEVTISSDGTLLSTSGTESINFKANIKYSLKEKTAPTNYALDNNTYYFCLGKDGKCTLTDVDEKYRLNSKDGVITLTDKRLFYLEITKKDVDDSTLLANAEYEIYDLNDNKIETNNPIVTDANGKVTIASATNDITSIVASGLKLNTKYYLKEKTAPSGYDLDTTKHYFYITEQDSNAEDKLVLDTNNKVYIELTDKHHFDVTLKKVDVDDDTTLDGSIYKLVGDGVDKEITISSDGTLLSTSGTGSINFKANIKYSLKETKAPDNYELDDTTYYFCLGKDGVCTLEDVDENYRLNSKDGVITLKDKHHFDVTLKKADVDDDTLLDGSVYTLTGDDINEDISISSEGTLLSTNGEGSINFKAGVVYSLKEKTAPDNYVLDENTYKFCFGKDGVCALADDSVIKLNSTNGEIKLSDKRLFYLEINKSDVDEETLLGNAEYEIYDADGNKVETSSIIKTNDEGKAIIVSTYVKDDSVVADMKLNTQYYLLETKAPSGYELDTTKHYFYITQQDLNLDLKGQQLVLNADNTVSIALTNKMHYDVTIRKIDNYGHALSKAIYGLYKEDDTLITKGTSDEGGLIIFDGSEGLDLKHDEQYYIKEIKAPDGYYVDEEKHYIYFGLEDNDSLKGERVDYSNDIIAIKDEKIPTKGNTCEEVIGEDWTWSETKKACVYKVNNTSTK